MSEGSYGLRDVCGNGHVITEDQIVIAGAGIDVVTCHVIVTVYIIFRCTVHKLPFLLVLITCNTMSLHYT
jgi:hypothetical protein